MNTLIEILLKTPELNSNERVGTDKNTQHTYITKFYEKEFEKYKDKPISLLEIGVCGGGSLYLWGKYFKNGTILGIDIEDCVRDCWKGLPNVSYLFQDAYNESLANSLPNFDIIIDDGPHTIQSQASCIKLYLSKLKEGGVLVIEDIFGDIEVLKRSTPPEYHDRIEIVDLRPASGRYDDLMFVIRK